MLSRIAISMGLSLSALSAAHADCADTRVDLRGDWGAARFTVELADAPDERALGLMHRENLPRSSGMLFVYDYPQRVGFWMENTLVPLDMIFMDEAGVVQKVHENAVPLDRTLIPGGDDILAVLEINGGMARALGIDVGTQLRHPALDPSVAAWPCKPDPSEADTAGTATGGD